MKTVALTQFMIQTFTADSDADGIVDILDLCPNVAENYNRFLDTDGCPDDPIVGDYDQDGISNAVDLCPNVSETYNGLQTLTVALTLLMM